MHCERCPAWKKEKKALWGRCRLAPPWFAMAPDVPEAVEQQGQAQRAWPVTLPDDWCWIGRLLMIKYRGMKTGFSSDVKNNINSDVF